MFKELDDKDLFDAFAKGDEDAGEQLYKKCYSAVLAYVFKATQGTKLSEADKNVN